MKNLPWILGCFLAAIACPYTYGANPGDSSTVEENVLEITIKSFDQAIIEELREDSDFQYDQPPDTRSNFLQVMFQKLFEWLVAVFGNKVFAWLVIILLILVGVVGLGFAFYGIFGIGKTMPIYSKDLDKLDYSVMRENIHEMNFSDEIELAVEQKDYKKAIRLMYLHALKLLTDQQIIDWLPSKTNHDYLYEIKNEQFQKPFSKLSYYFEYVWYGDFQPNIAHYKEMDHTFAGLKSNLGKHV